MSFLSVPEDSLPIHRADFRGEWLCTVPSVRGCHVRVLSRLPGLELRNGRLVTSAHVGPSLTNDDLRGMEPADRHVAVYLPRLWGSDDTKVVLRGLGEEEPPAGFG
jgi:hypothetical protein